jgi:biopolymer transport protein TolQ
MDPNLVTAAPIATPEAAMSIWSLVMQADLVVKSVMLILALASLWCWAVIFEKVWRLASLKRRTTGFERAFWSGAPLEDLYRRLAKRPDHPMAMMFATAMEEWREAPRSAVRDGGAHLLERIGRVMRLAMDRELVALERSVPTLATIGSVAPFLGLFGTVWGIMNSFTAIAVSKNTTLTVVAPGIAEALFATAIGLAAAIPAVVAYNKLSGEIDRYAERLESFGEEFQVVLAREIEASRAA